MVKFTFAKISKEECILIQWKINSKPLSLKLVKNQQQIYYLVSRLIHKA